MPRELRSRGGDRMVERLRSEPTHHGSSIKWDDSKDLATDSGPGTAPPSPARLNLKGDLTQCPHCTRNFSKEAAERHVPICSQLKTRPKAPVKKELLESFTDSLGRRHKTSLSRPGTAGSCKTPSGMPNSPLNVSTPARSGHSQIGTPSSAAGRKLNMGEECADVSATGSSAGAVSELSEQWGILQFLLRDGCEALWDDAAIGSTSSRVDSSLSFLVRLEELAKSLNMRKGALSRMLLPFDSETSSGDQASTAALAPLGSQELEGLIPNDERRDLVSQAVALRRLIRIKVADCNDIEQARESLRLAGKFLRSLKHKAVEEQRTMTSVLREL